LREWRKMYEGTSMWWYVQARNKKSVTGNMRVRKGGGGKGERSARKLLPPKRICRREFGPGALVEKWNLGSMALAKINPPSHHGAVSGYAGRRVRIAIGRFGSDRRIDGGIAYVTGLADRPPGGSASRSATLSRRSTGHWRDDGGHHRTVNAAAARSSTSRSMKPCFR